MSVLITLDGVPEIGINILRQHHLNIFTMDTSLVPTKEEVIAKLKEIDGADAIFWPQMRNLDKDIIDAAGTKLKVIGLMSAGYNHVDVEYLKSKNIKLGHTPNILTDAVAELAILLALAVAKRVKENRELIESGKWTSEQQPLLCHELRNATVGIVGFGGIGQKLAKKLHNAFDIEKLLYSGPRAKPEADAVNAEYVPLDTLLKQSDYIFLTLPLNQDTKNLINFSKFLLMKSSAILVNVSRGEVIEQDDLVQALKRDLIFGAGLDVMTPEPLPTHHTLIKLDNCVLTPHIGSAALPTRNDMSKLTAANIIAGLSGQKLPASVY